MICEEFVLEWGTPLGVAKGYSNGRALTRLSIADGAPSLTTSNCKVLGETRAQICAYFEGDLKKFTVPIEPIGTEFQRNVWKHVSGIPYGETQSYGDIAKTLQLKHGQRAVGSANGDNPLWIIIPCHRVIGADGGLCGYAGGLWRKQALIGLESGQMSLI